MKFSKIIILSMMASVLMSCKAEAFRDDFNTFDTSKWGIGTWQSPASDGKNHTGRFSSDNVKVVNGYLRLELTQSLQENGSILSLGSEVHSIKEFGFGTYEFRMKSSSTAIDPNSKGSAVSGSVSAAFVYAHKAITEIDVEFEGNKKNKTHLLTWQGEDNPNEHSPKKLSGKNPHEKFYTYKFVWTPKEVRFYRDDVLIETHTEVVPQKPGKMTFNHWGTNSKWWGGFATNNVKRYVYIDYFEFTPFDSTSG